MEDSADEIAIWSEQSRRICTLQDILPAIEPSSTHISFYNNYLGTPSLELDTIKNWHFGTVLPKLKALLTSEKYQWQVGSPALSSSTEEFSDAYFRLVTISFSNGFAGLRQFPVADILAYLQMRFTTKAISDFADSLGSTAGRSFAESLLQCAMMAGRPDIVDYLLLRDKFGLDVNQYVLLHSMERLTLVEYAAAHQNLAITRILLKRGADLGKTHEGAGALDRLVRARQQNDASTTDEEFYEHAQLLIRGNVPVENRLLSQLLRLKITKTVSDLIELIVRHDAHNSHYSWLRDGNIHNAVKQLDPSASMRISQTLVEVGANLNFHQRNDLKTLIDAAAHRGSLALLRMLWENGAVHTKRTFTNALFSGNHELISHLINDGAVSAPGPSLSFSMVDAINDGGNEVFSLLQVHPVTANAYSREILCASIYVASEEGDTANLERLLDSFERSYHTSFMTGEACKVLGIALTKALNVGQETAALALLDKGANVNENNHTTAPALIQALRKKNKKLVCALVEADANVYDLDARGTPLMLATEWGDEEVVRLLLREGVDVNEKSRRSHMRPMSSALLVAVSAKNVSIATILLEAGADASAVLSPNSMAPLSVAVKNDDIAMINLLLDFGADWSHSSVILEALDSATDIFSILISEYDRKHPRDRRKFSGVAIQTIIRQGNVNKLRRLLELTDQRIELNRFAGRNNECGALEGWETPLATAISSDTAMRLQVTRLLLEYGADANLVSSEERSSSVAVGRQSTPLLDAISWSDAKVVELLLEFGADINWPARRYIKRTPLQRAAEQGSFDITMLLLQRGALVNGAPSYSGGATALQLAAIGGYDGIVELLLDNGAVDDQCAKVNGRTSIEGAAEHGCLDTVQLLLERGVQLDPNNRGIECAEIFLAERNGHFAVADYLRSYLQEICAIQIDADLSLPNQTAQPIEHHMLVTESDPAPIVQQHRIELEDQANGPHREVQADRLEMSRVCQQCHQRLCNSSALARHVRSKHSNMSEHRCNTCSRTFKRKDMLLRHSATHMKADLHACHSCGRFPRKHGPTSRYPAQKG